MLRQVAMVEPLRHDDWNGIACALIVTEGHRGSGPIIAVSSGPVTRAEQA